MYIQEHVVRQQQPASWGWGWAANPVKNLAERLNEFGGRELVLAAGCQGRPNVCYSLLAFLLNPGVDILP